MGTKPIVTPVNRRIAENRGVGKGSELSPKPFPLRIPLQIKREIVLDKNELAILKLLEEEERKYCGEV